jgi:predicted Zn-dependent protease
MTVGRSGSGRYRRGIHAGLAAACGIGLAYWGLVLRPVDRLAESARQAVRSGRYQDAGRLLHDWREQRPSSGEVYLWIARNALALRKPADEVSRLYERARSLGCPRREREVFEALGLVRQGRYREAEPALRRVFEHDPRPDAQVDEALAQAYLENYALAAASEVIDRWARDFPADATPYLWRAEIDRRVEGRASFLIDDYLQARKRDPANDTAALGLAEELRKAHRNTEAAVEFAAYLARHPQNPAALLGAARNARELGDDDDAERWLSRATSAAPENVEIYRERGDLALRQGAFAKALHWLDIAVRLDPFDIATRYNRGLVLRRLGQAEQADRELAESARLRAEQTELIQAQTALAKHPNDRRQQVKIARWMFTHGHEPEGVRWAEKILRDQPGHPEACRLLAEYYAKVGKPGLANSYRAQTVNTGN